MFDVMPEEPDNKTNGTEDTEEENRILEQYCGRLFETINSGVVIHKIVYDKKGKPVDYIIKQVNPAFIRITGVEANKIIGKLVSKLIGEKSPIFWEYFESAIINNKPAFFETYIDRIDKNLKFFFFPINKFYFGTIFEDITELKIRELSLVEEKERLNVTLQSIREGVITTDRRGKILFINSFAEELTGYRAKEAKGQFLGKILGVKNYKKYGNWEDCNNNDFDKLKEITLNSKNGEQYNVEQSCSPICNVNGEITGAVIIVRDITEKQKLEKEVAKAETLQSLGILAGGIAHDFNNILASILGNISLAQMFLEEKDNLLMRLKSVERATIRAKDLTKRLLTFSKGGAPIREMASLKDLLVDSATFILGGSNVRCKFEIENQLWNVEIDKGQISQVVQNLVLNADQAMPEGGTILIQAENISFEEKGGKTFPGSKYNHYVMITIKDEGIGIPESYMAKIFDPFFTTKYKGSGLGLAISYSIVKGHEGHITASSTPGKGTSFTIYLPALPVVKRGEIKEENKEKSLILGKGRILVMDDDYSIIEFLSVLLDKLGYTACFVNDGKGAVDLYKKAFASGNKFDAVVLDLTIPGGMGGKETLKQLKEIDPNVKAIVSSGHSMEPIMAESLDSGFKGVLSKPYKPEEMSRILHDVLKHS